LNKLRATLRARTTLKLGGSQQASSAQEGGWKIGSRIEFAERGTVSENGIGTLGWKKGVRDICLSRAGGLEARPVGYVNGYLPLL